MKSLYQSLIDAGIPIASHESDLYFPVQAQTVAILDQFESEQRCVTRFRDQVTGEIWFDVPFAYLPYWEAHCPQPA